MIALWRWIMARFHRRPVTAPPVVAPAPVTPAPVIVPPPPPPPTRVVPQLSDFTKVLAFADFSDGTTGPWSKGATTDIVPDPTGELGGNVARILYSNPGGKLSSSDRELVFVPARKFRYNEPLLFRGKVFFPSACVTGGPQNADDARKVVDWFTGGKPYTRLVFDRIDGNRLRYNVGQYEPDGTWRVDVTIGYTGLVLNDDQWYDLAVMVLPNSADGVRDGVLQVWANNKIDFQSFTLDKNFSPITERDGGISCFEELHVGAQLTSQPDGVAMSQYRYWKDVGLYTVAG